MDNWEPHLHWAFRQEHVLFPSLVLHSTLDFTVAVLFLILICLLERTFTLLLEKRCAPRFISRSRWRRVVWRTCLYWMATLLRLFYMLAAMTFQLGIILVIVTSLALGHLMIECWETDTEPVGAGINIEDESRVSPGKPKRHYYSLGSMNTPKQISLRTRSKSQNTSVQPSHDADTVHAKSDTNGTTQAYKETTDQKSPVSLVAKGGHAKALEMLARPRKTCQKDEESFLIGEPDSDTESSES